MSFSHSRLSGLLVICGCLVSGCGAERPVVAKAADSTEAERREGRWHQELRDLKRRLDEAEIVFADDFDREELGDKWIVEEGQWTTCRAAGQPEAGVIGTNGENYPDSFLWTTQSFDGDLVIDVEAECLSDPPNDINLVMCGKPPNYPPPEVPLYLFALGGWGNTKTGIERAPDYDWKVLTSLFTLQAKKRYHIQAARIGGDFYLFVDGRLVLEGSDVDPLPASGHVALHVFDSRVRYSNLRLRKP